MEDKEARAIQFTQEDFHFFDTDDIVFSKSGLEKLRDAGYVRLVEQKLPETSKTGELLDAMKMIRRIIRNSREAPNVIDTIDWTAMNAISEFLKPNQ